MITARRACLGALVALLACHPGDAPPGTLDTKNETCRSCRMPVSDAHLACQLAAAGEEPRFFDEIGCLQSFLKQNGPSTAHSVAYVADHRTGAWVRASTATYSHCPSLETPMGSHMIAHADPASRDADAAARACTGVPEAEIFGPGGPPNGKKAG
jgi:copper chaperone NosL